MFSQKDVEESNAPDRRIDSRERGHGRLNIGYDPWFPGEERNGFYCTRVYSFFKLEFQPSEWFGCA